MTSTSTTHAFRLALLLAASPALGCVLLIREPEAYREDVIEIVSEGREGIEACYEKGLEERQMALETREREAQGPYADIGPTVKEQLSEEAGWVVLRFEVEAKTGKLHDAKVDEAKTTAPAFAVECVMASLEGLAIEEPDHEPAEVTLAWQLKVGKPNEDRPGVPSTEGGEGPGE